MNHSRIASALLAPALAAILAIACSSSDNNGGPGTSVGGNGNGTGGSGPTPVTNKAACNDAFAAAKKCATSTPTAAQEKQFQDTCNAAKTSCAKCITDAGSDCETLAGCLVGEVCAPASSGEGGTGGTGGGNTGKGGTGGTGGGGNVDPEECLANCDADNPDGANALNTAFVEKCGCAAGSACASECGASCDAKQVDEACGTCLSNLGQSDACVNDVISACQADADCTKTITCYSECQDSGSGGSGGSGGGSGGQACVNQCGMDNPDGIEAFNADQQNLTKCLCEGAACKDKCSTSPICTEGKPQGTQECISCQDECFAGCQADPACKKLYDCVQGCN